MRPLAQDLSRRLAALAPKVAASAWKRLQGVRKLEKTDLTRIALDSLRDRYHARIQDETQGSVPLNRVLHAVLTTLDALCAAGPIVRDALTTRFPLTTIALYPTDEITTGCYAGAMADYEIDEATLHIACGRLFDNEAPTLTLGTGAHNVGRDFRTVLAHEIGHLVMPDVEAALHKKIRIVFDEHTPKFWEQTISKYAGTDDHEMFAEAFAAYTHPDYGATGGGVNGDMYKVLPACLLSTFVEAGIVAGTRVALSKARRTPTDVVTEDGEVVSAATVTEILDAVADGDWFAVEGTMKPAMQEAFEDAGYAEVTAAGIVSGTAEGAKLFETVDKGAEKYAEDHAAELITGLTDTTRDSVRGTIEDAITEGWSRPELELELQNNFAFSEARANTIAHTELAIAHSRGRIDVATEAGATGKRWLLSDDHEDEDECDDCADAGVVDMDEDFDGNGNDFPPAHPNCLCDWAAEYGTEADDDAEGDDAETVDDAEEADDTEKFAKWIDVDNVDYEEDYDVDYTSHEPAGEELALGAEVTDIANVAVTRADRYDRDGQRIAGRARAATLAACAGHEVLIDRLNDHRRAYELHALAAKHYECDVVNAQAAALHAAAAEKHLTIVGLLDLQWRAAAKFQKDFNPDEHPRDQKGEFLATGGQKPKGPLHMHTRIRQMLERAHNGTGPEASKEVSSLIKVPPPPTSAENRGVINNYVSGSSSLNNALRNQKGDASKLGSSGQKSVAVLDKMLSESRNYNMTIKMTRGVPDHVMAGAKVGDTLVEHGFSSTSFARSVANNFGSGTSRLDITIPKGFMFLSIPSFAKAAGTGGLAMKEAEAILPRGTGYRITGVSKEGNVNVYKVNAVFNSLQPAGTAWASTKARAMREKKGG